MKKLRSPRHETHTPDKHGTAKRVLIRYYGRTEGDCRDPERCYRAMAELGYKWDEKEGVWRSGH